MKGGFALLSGAGLITAQLSARRQRMIGLRNIAVQQHQEPDREFIEPVIRSGLDDHLTFAETVRPHLPGSA